MISLRNLSLHYNHTHGVHRVLQGISLDIRDGEYVALMGANGSGKTSLARCLNGILKPSAGEVWVDGMSTASSEHLQEIRRRVGMVFQQPENQIVAPIVEREIAFGLENLGLLRDEMRRRVEEMLQRFELARYRHQAPNQLSGGEKQRLALAAIMAMRPRCVIFDEPTSLLDYPHRLRLFQTIADLRRENQQRYGSSMTVLLITQFPEEALYAERLLILHQGELVMDGSPLEILQQTEALDRIGLQAPLELRAYDYLRVHSDQGLALDDFLLEPPL